VRIAIAAAGTGGHVYPALAVAAALEERGLGRTDVFFLGGDRIEAQAIPAAGYRFVGYELTKLRRSLTLENLRIPFVVRRAAITMADELRRSDAAAVLGMVGYVTVPAALAARRAGIPFVVHEQNAAPTLAARFGGAGLASPLSAAADRSGCRDPEVVGNPRSDRLAAFDRARAPRLGPAMGSRRRVRWWGSSVGHSAPERSTRREGLSSPRWVARCCTSPGSRRRVSGTRPTGRYRGSGFRMNPRCRISMPPSMSSSAGPGR
jgi:UDP-N-acetylglucosamine:LPS N-acetylglucosamine transferase